MIAYGAFAAWFLSDGVIDPDRPFLPMDLCQKAFTEPQLSRSGADLR